MSDPKGRVILGLDPGTASTGFGVIEMTGNRMKALEYGVIETAAGLPLEERLAEIFARVEDILRRYGPVATAVESLFFNVNVRTALAVGQARGVTLLACAQAGCGVFEYTPQQIKRAVAGYGKADKTQVMEMVKVLLGLAEVPRPDHAADALGVAICHANSSGVQNAIDQALARAAKRSDGR